MSYTTVAKPTGNTYTTPPRDVVEYPQYGTAIYGVSLYGKQDTYSRATKPTGSTYTTVAKPT